MLKGGLLDLRNVGGWLGAGAQLLGHPLRIRVLGVVDARFAAVTRALCSTSYSRSRATCSRCSSTSRSPAGTIVDQGLIGAPTPRAARRRTSERRCASRRRRAGAGEPRGYERSPRRSEHDASAQASSPASVEAETENAPPGPSGARRRRRTPAAAVCPEATVVRADPWIAPSARDAVPAKPRAVPRSAPSSSLAASPHDLVSLPVGQRHMSRGGTGSARSARLGRSHGPPPTSDAMTFCMRGRFPVVLRLRYTPIQMRHGTTCQVKRRGTDRRSRWANE